MRPIIRWTLWQRRWSIVWWSIGLAAFIAINLAFYPTFRAQAAQLGQVLEHLPSATRSLISDSGDFLTPDGFLSVRLFYLMLPLLLSILAIGLGSSLLAREEADGTIELLLARPISRGKLLAAKALSGLTIILIVGSVVLAATLLMCWLVKIEVGLRVIGLAVALATLLATLFGMVAFWVTAFGRAARAASIGVAAFIGLGSYLLASLANNVELLKAPAHFLPYYYYRPSAVLHQQYNWWYGLAFGLVIGLLYLWAWAAFRHRDIG